jgi:hypothetical protein
MWFLCFGVVLGMEVLFFANFYIFLKFLVYVHCVEDKLGLNLMLGNEAI